MFKNPTNILMANKHIFRFTLVIKETQNEKKMKWVSAYQMDFSFMKIPSVWKGYGE